ncbi:hypothetical protein CDV36_014170 [Fusarium kuroshium]|uniref:Uncharacterized protein n=2 Tax=Fusarium solani species complex TaxID=232080 RepID=A0A3M2RIK3_9HYPO|nr:hypothetical protein CDV36_014170 [Fusarium kuroshium]RSL91311.1 hypothetical protein CDV31_015483 [Fusarium ambrosium]
MGCIIEDLDPQAEFPADETRDAPHYIEGKGQRISWRNCFVTVFERDKNGQMRVTKTYPKGDGQTTLPTDADLYLVGPGGRVRQESV